MDRDLIVQALLDVINQLGHTSAPSEHPTPPDTENDSDTMVSPLQQELELMKKAAGVPSAFDGAEEESDCGCGSDDGDMDALRHMAGIKIVR